MTRRNPEATRAYDRQYQQVHRDRIQAYNRAYKEANRERIRRRDHDRYLRQRSLLLQQSSRNRPLRHGLTLQEFVAMLANQGYACAICCTPFKKTPNIDHDHECCPGQYSCGLCVRGLLCTRCNQTLGLGSEVLIRAMAYIEGRGVSKERSPAAVEGGDANTVEATGPQEGQAATASTEPPSTAPADAPTSDDPGAAFRQ